MALSIALVAPFLFAQNNYDNNIFMNGTVPTIDPELSNMIECKIHGGEIIGSAEGASFDDCKGLFASHFSRTWDEAKSRFHQICHSGEPFWRSHNEMFVEYKVATNPGTACNVWQTYLVRYQSGEVYTLKKCPPKDAPDMKANWYHPDRDPEEVDKCFNPDQADLLDNCKVSSGYEFLDFTTGGSTGKGCFALPDGSVCSYQSVDVGGGNNIYQMDLETSCYQGEHEIIYPNQPFEMPDTNDNQYSCAVNGGLLSCEEIPEEVCEGTDCPRVPNKDYSCGYMNNTFLCVDNDTDGDMLPDYLDPDIDGDGIRNEDDLDSDGDGNDDPIRKPGSGNNPGTGGVTVELDLNPVTQKLDQINKGVNETNVEIKKQPTEGLTSFWESEYEDGFGGMFQEKINEIKETPMFKFLDKFAPPSFSGAPANFNFCFDLGALGNFGCQEMGIDPRIVPAIKIIILISAGFFCRRIIFGG